MRLPEVQAELRAEAARMRLFGFLDGPEETAQRLERWADEIKRKPRATHAPAQSAPMTDTLRRRIRAMSAEHPTMSQHDIAKLLGTNQGRVSEVLAGKRT